MKIKSVATLRRERRRNIRSNYKFMKERFPALSDKTIVKHLKGLYSDEIRGEMTVKKALKVKSL